MSRPVLVIGNPAAGRGRARTRWQGVASSLPNELGEHELVWTEAPGDAERVARREGNARALVVAYGGDGTASEVARGLALAAEAGRPVAELGLLPAGTGNDFAGDAGAPGRLRDAVRFLARTRALPTDLGRVESGDGWSRYFLNSCSVGLAAAVNERVAAGSARLGRGAYGAAAARELVSHRARRFRVGLDEHPLRPRLLLLFSVLNSRRFGGGIPLAPGAHPGDGLLDAVLIGPLGPIRLAEAVGRLVRGTHFGHPAIEHHAVRQVRVEPLDAEGPDGLALELDGETARARGGLRISVAPGLLRIRRRRRERGAGRSDDARV